VENERRVQVIMETIKEKGLISSKDIHQPLMATEEDLLRVHTKDHVEHVKRFCQMGGGNLDFDTTVSPESYEIAKLSAGGAIKAAELVLDGYDSAYSVGRPPGHHATRNRAMGFCIFNNLAITLEYLRGLKRIKRFLVFDFDVHYGNGTADIFYEDPDVMYISIHQEPRTLFPGKGNVSEIGSGEGEGRNLCIPMPRGSNSHDYRYILEKVLGPVAFSFAPEFYLVDVGFDGHRDDPLSGIRLDDEFFTWIGVEMMDLAQSLAVILEGGYDLDALARCNTNLIDGLENYKTFKEEYEKRNQESVDKSQVHQETRQIYNSLSDIFSPYFDI
jgi:acetoin utilization deacetylase AcuC-like enzyme